MAKAKSMYICRECGAEYPKWSGKCLQCGSWNTLEETVILPAAKGGSISSAAAAKSAAAATPITEINFTDEQRYNTGIGELNRVLGGGIVKGSVVLLSGDPGIGKSTILLQVAGNLAKRHSVLYVTGEESANQLKLRAQRLGVNQPALSVMAESDVLAICGYISHHYPVLFGQCDPGAGMHQYFAKNGKNLKYSGYNCWPH